MLILLKKGEPARAFCDKCQRLHAAGTEKCGKRSKVGKDRARGRDPEVLALIAEAKRLAAARYA